jgi:hypothetical protein
MKGKNVFGKVSVYGVIWQLALVTIVTVALVERFVPIGGGNVIA